MRSEIKCMKSGKFICVRVFRFVKFRLISMRNWISGKCVSILDLGKDDILVWIVFLIVDLVSLQLCDIVMEDMLTASERKSLQMDEKQAQQGSCSGDCEKVDSNEVSQGVLGDLPEVCIAVILSCLPPREVVKLACVCRSFRSASNFDSVWENILPPKYKDSLALDPDAVPARFASKREIFDYLCNPMIFANNTQVCVTYVILCFHGAAYIYW